MSKNGSKNGIDFKGNIDKDDLADMLVGMAQNIRQGAICLREHAETVRLNLGDRLEFEIKAETKKDKYKLMMELKWEYVAEPPVFQDSFSICSPKTNATADALRAQAPPVKSVIGIPSDEKMDLANAWSIKKDLLGKDVYNAENERIGSVEDLIVTPDEAISSAIVGTGGFLGMSKHDVAVPVNRFKVKGKHIVLPGATKVSVKAMPEFKYAG